MAAAQAALSGAQREAQVQKVLANANAAQLTRLADLPERMQAALATAAPEPQATPDGTQKRDRFGQVSGAIAQRPSRFRRHRTGPG